MSTKRAGCGGGAGRCGGEVAEVGEEETKRGLSEYWNGEWRMRVRSDDDVTVLDCSLDS